MNIKELVAIVIEQRDEMKSSDTSAYCVRLEELQLELDSLLGQVVIGVRRSGKSTICEMFLKQNNVDFAYVNFDDNRLVNMQAVELDNLLEALYIVYGDFKYLFLDEIQNIRDWPLFVNRLLRQKVHVYITGSNSKLLSNELSTHLTGRVNKVELYPFSFAEYCKMSGVDAKSPSVKARGLCKSALLKYLHQGGFPELLKVKNRSGYVNGLLDAIIRNDIAHRFNIRNSEALRRIAAYLIDNFCQEFTAKTIGKLFGVSNHTAENYYAYLKEAFLLVGINRFSYKSKSRIRNEKVYVIDTSFVTEKKHSIVSENIGWKLENVVCIELLRRCRAKFYDVFYYKDASSQVDFVIAKNGVVIELIQVSYDISIEKTLKREIRGLVNASKKLDCDKLTLITFYEIRDEFVDGFNINVVSATEWLTASI